MVAQIKWLLFQTSVLTFAELNLAQQKKRGSKGAVSKVGSGRVAHAVGVQSGGSSNLRMLRTFFEPKRAPNASRH
jgi:hypothetical protein